MNKKVLSAVATVFFAMPAFAQDAHAAIGSQVGWVMMGIGIMMGLAVLGGALGQGKAAAAALDGVSRNPAAVGKLQTLLILSLALMESLVLFAFLIGILLQGAVGTALGKI
jgi:F-type H+-transporting ATPase subunit c